MKNIFLITIILLLQGCFKMGKDYVQPKLDIEPGWDALQSDQAEELIEQKEVFEQKDYWWDKFSDSHLSALVEESLEYNHDLRIAEARIKEAVANERAAFAGIFPQIDLTGSFDRSKSGPGSGNVVDRSTRSGLRGSWDLDIFGSTRRRQEAAEAGIEVSEAEKRRIKLAIIAEVARNYIRLRKVKQQEELIVDNIKIQEDTLEATKIRRSMGAISDLEVTRAEAQVESTKALLPQVRVEGDISINRLHALTGVSQNKLREIALENAPIPTVNSKIIVDTPLNVISNRPDVKAAERNLAAATALTGAAIADMFPKLSLQGFFGAAESNFFGAGAPWNVTANGLMPILNFGRLRQQVKAADARQEQALAEYEKAVVLALEEVNNSFSQLMNEQDRVARLATVLNKRKRVSQIAKEQYRAGAVTQLDLLVAQQNQLDAENELVNSQSTAADNMVLLYRALGVGNSTE